MTTTTRRDFIRVSALAGGGFMLATRLPVNGKFAEALGALAEPFAPNAWIRVASDGAITFVIDRSEMGQGIETGLSMLLAEEMDADWSAVRTVNAPVDPVYNNRAFGIQATGGSSSTPSSWQHIRQAGAAAREMLVAAAAQQWGVDAASCTTSKSVITHAASGRTARYGDIAANAASQPVPKEPKLKDPKDYTIIGTRVHRLDTPAKVNGSARFGIDVTLPGMLVCVVARPTAFGATVATVDDSKARAVAGVRRVVQISSGVAVIADGYHAATKGRNALVITWNKGKNATNSSAAISRQMRDAAKQPGLVARHEGQGTDALRTAAKVIEAEYEVPFLAHAAMEPMNAVADVRTDGCDIYAPTQRQDESRAVGAKITGLDPAKVAVHTTYLGGGFGRKFETDFIADAVEASKAAGAPVKVIYTREDDIRHDFYRTAAYNKMAAGLDADGWPIAWTNTVVSASTFVRAFPQFLQNGLDGDCVDGAANIPYEIPNIHVNWVMQDFGVPVGFWRGVGVTQNAFVSECFIDELAAAAKKDPVEYRRHLLSKSPKHLAVLNLAAEKAGWGKPLPAGRHRGVAVQLFNGTVVAQVAEVSVANGAVKVHRIVCAADCGRVINPDSVEAQVQGGVVFGLTAALKGQITIEGGGVKQGNFNDYPMLRMSEVPVVEAYFVPSTDPPSGMGEPPTVAVAPAVANAVRAATGVPVRTLPIRIAAPASAR